MECTPQVKEPNHPAIEPILLKLSVCFHCKKQLCNSCRTKHYNIQRNESLKLLLNFIEGSESIINTSQQLSDARSNKIVEYEKSKLDVIERRQELLRIIEKEEQDLLKRLDDEIAIEKKYFEIFLAIFMMKKNY